MLSADTRQFYDDLSPFYDLIYEDWDVSMERQGTAFGALITSELGTLAPEIRVLDAACGIGTQALPLARQGFQVTGRDLSGEAITRLRREASARHLTIDAGVADMRAVASSVSGSYDAVLACDNSLPHLMADEEILTAFRQFRHVLRPGGLCIASVRDYAAVPRGVDTTHPYGERHRGNETFTLRQEWHWEDTTHYSVTLIVEGGATPPRPILRTTARYYAVTTERLLELMAEAGFVNCRRMDDLIYQPVLLGDAA